MTDEPATARIEALYRYPAKGLSADALTSVEIGAGKPIAYDRAFAIENGASGFDPLNPVPLPKTKFLMLMSHERLATLATRFDAADTRLTISRDGKDVASGRLDQQIGRQLIEQFLSTASSPGRNSSGSAGASPSTAPTSSSAASASNGARRSMSIPRAAPAT